MQIAGVVPDGRTTHDRPCRLSYQLNTACFICKHVMDGVPILGMAHDHEGDLQLVCGREGHKPDDWHVVGVGHIDHKR